MLSIWTTLKNFMACSTLSQTSPCLQYKSYENTMGKGEIAHNEQFFLFPQFFHPFGELSAIFIKFEIVICKLFQLERV